MINCQNRSGTLTTQSDEVQLISVHKESFQQVMIREHMKGAGINELKSQSTILRTGFLAKFFQTDSRLYFLWKHDFLKKLVFISLAG